MSVLDEIRQQYPTLAFLVNDPEIGPLLKDAVDPNKGFSPQEFQARLYQTNWWKSRSAVKRNMETMAHTDPGEYKRLLTDAASKTRLFARQLGYNLSSNEIRWIATTNLNNGVQVGSEEFMLQMRNFLSKKKAKDFDVAGGVSAAAMKAREIAARQYYVPFSDAEAKQWGIDLALGMKDEAAFQNHMLVRAASMYPHLKQLLYQGQSMEDIFSGHRELIAQELEISPNQIDFTKDFKKVLYQVDPETGKPRPMTLHETQTLARQDSRWWGTSGGRKADAGMANFMLKMFGKRA